jgi:GntR family transcriptional regulator of arabinose operon
LLVFIVRGVVLSIPPKKLDRFSPLPLYHQLRVALLDRIASKEFRPGDALPSERQLASDYHVSRITVIQALKALEDEGVLERHQGRGTFVAEPARHEERTFTSDQTMAFLAPVLTDPFLFDIMHGVEKVASSHGFSLIMMCSHEDPVQESNLVREASKRGIGGVIVYPIQDEASRPTFQALLQEGYPLVFIDRYYPALPADRVVSDDQQAAFAITQQLLAKGHRRIAFVTWYETACTSVQDRISGYRAALLQAEIEPDPKLIWQDLYAGENKDGNNPNRLRILLDEQAPTALVVVNFIVSGYLLSDLARLGMQVQKDIAVAGFDLNHPSIHSPLTSPAAIQHGSELGRRAANFLLERIQNFYQGPPRHAVIPTQLILKEPDYDFPLS